MHITRVIWPVLLALISIDARAQDGIHADGFENVLPECLSGTLGGDTLPLPPLGQAELLGCFEINNDATDRFDELAFGGLPIARSAALDATAFDRLIVIGPEGLRRPAEFRTLSRWGQPLANAAAPVRWLETALAIDLASSSTATLALMRLPAAPAPVVDPGALQLSLLGTDHYLIDSGTAEFDIDGTQSQPIRRIRVRQSPGGALTEIFAAQPGSADEGLAIEVREIDGTPILEASEALAGSLVVDRTRWETVGGSVRATLHIDGHLAVAGNGDLCENDPNWLRFPYSLSLRFNRGSAAIDLDLQLGNACGIPQSTPDDALVEFGFAEFRLPLARGVLAQTQALAAAITNPQTFAMGSTQAYQVSQRRGGGAPWQRSAQLTEDGNVLSANSFFLHPAAGLIRPLSGQARLVAMATMPWMRYREPQALAVQNGRLTLALIAEPTRVGKAKSLWFSGRIAMSPADDQVQALNLLAGLRLRNSFAAERALVLRALPQDLDMAQVQPPLAGTLSHAPGQAYLQYLQLKHLATVGDEPCTDAGGGIGSQWTCARTFGLQLWPDIQFNEQFGFTENPDPASNEGKLNYWDPALIELIEFQRSGQPRWLWEFALPQARLMAYTAYFNFGPFPNGAGANSNIAGHSFGSGGNGDGLWHRSNSGSADYTYNRHQALSYVLRPSLAQQDRFAAAGHAASLRFFDDPNDDTTWSAIGRLNLQYIESLANCAQFVEGTAGSICDTRLREVLSRLVQNSLSAGLMCELKFELGPDCFMGQNFMLYAWFYPILERLYLNYAHTFPVPLEQAWRHALGRTPAQLLASLPTTPGGDVDVNASWPNGVSCQLGGPGFTQVVSCTAVPDPDNLTQNKLAMLSLLVRGQQYDGLSGLCAATRQIGSDLFQGTSTLGVLQAVAGGGWWKGAVESAQELSTAALGYGRCPALGSAR
jgi:hypothetical protein